ncbi:amylo-alpha-1,6-glucosidase [Aquabacter sp. CN5-332]|uniref:amylo-alpha-1,6-glucosidase n=1 Tax=Aquabacter sp. CN5-332 TaxID=3156608 RepID=UPI0032B501E9
MQTISAENVAHAPVPAGPGASQLAQFFIPATASLQERRPRTLKHGDTFGVFDHNGDAISGPGSPEGLYHRDTRHLSHLYLTIAGERPILLSSTLRDDNATLTCDLTNPDVFDAHGRVSLAHDLVHLRRSRFLWNAHCFERLTVRNYDEASHRIRIGLSFSADFADMFEVRGTRRDRRGLLHAPRVGTSSVELSYTGLDDRLRHTVLRFDPAPESLTGKDAVFEFELPPQQSRSLFFEIGFEPSADDQPVPRNYLTALRDARRALRAARSAAGSVTTSNAIFNEAVERSMSDIYMLITDTPEGPYPYAGIPWFSTVFGRDALITAMEMLWLDPGIARGVLFHLAANQATRSDAKSDAEPGKILHEVRYGEMAELGEVPFRRYYGSVDSTPLFVMLAGAYFRHTNDQAAAAALWPHIEAALAWITDHGDRDGDGFVEYGRRTSEGLINQAWKDSHDSVFHADGTLARGPIAIVEVQAYVFGAWLAAAELARALGHDAQAAAMEARAEALRQRFDTAFFDPDLGTYALALDGDKRPCRVRSSNAGHALFTGIAYPERAAFVVRALMSSDSFCGWGVRTVASDAARYNPMAYHNGSVWPHDNALIAAGFSRYGFRGEAARIFEGLFAAATYIDLRRLPELFCGFRRQRAQGPTFYPVACAPQAWAAAAPLSLIQSCLGFSFDGGANRINFNQPVLPAFLDELVLRNLGGAKGKADVLLRRSGQQVIVEVLQRRGTIDLTTHL